ncbi:MAG TPA: polyketide synthase dehydratase domain-containing protein, partial [Candidatus Binatia bacterium]|nr:polyketide synthase dehydratase domain-containing protein [Candidatus Binatia bacterium]
LKNMGLRYGRSHRGIRALYVGHRQVLAELQLPVSIEDSLREYVLHPALVDSTLQATVGLMIDAERVPAMPPVAFALERFRVLSACTSAMVAWVRYGAGSGPEDGLPAIDIDLCDSDGNVCANMRGLRLRIMEPIARQARESANGVVKVVASPEDFNYEDLLARVADGEISVEAAVAAS